MLALPAPQERVSLTAPRRRDPRPTQAAPAGFGWWAVYGHGKQVFAMSDDGLIRCFRVQTWVNGYVLGPL